MSANNRSPSQEVRTTTGSSKKPAGNLLLCPAPREIRRPTPRPAMHTGGRWANLWYLDGVAPAILPGVPHHIFYPALQTHISKLKHAFYPRQNLDQSEFLQSSLLRLSVFKCGLILAYFPAPFFSIFTSFFSGLYILIFRATYYRLQNLTNNSQATIYECSHVEPMRAQGLRHRKHRDLMISAK